MSAGDKMEILYQHCTQALKLFEIWPGYYERRYQEFKKFYSIFPQKKINNSLEIGCGIGYQSALLSYTSENVFATDVNFGNMQKHSRGIDIAKNFIAATKIPNIKVLEADAQSLPFENESFDFIYCCYSFQYIPDKAKALKEINRVLTKDGYFFCVLPTAADRIGATINYYISIFKKLLQVTFSKKTISKTIVSHKKITAKKRNILLPPADDEDNNYFKEIVSRLPSKWKKLFKDNGYVVKDFYHTAGHLKKNNFINRIIDSLHSSGLIIISQKI